MHGSSRHTTNAFNSRGNNIINLLFYLKLPDVAFLHHDGEEPDDHLGAGAEQHLPLASLLRIAHAFEGVSETVHTNHGF